MFVIACSEQEVEFSSQRASLNLHFMWCNLFSRPRLWRSSHDCTNITSVANWLPPHDSRRSKWWRYISNIQFGKFSCQYHCYETSVHLAWLVCGWCVLWVQWTEQTTRQLCHLLSLPFIALHFTYRFMFSPRQLYPWRLVPIPHYCLDVRSPLLFIPAKWLLWRRYVTASCGEDGSEISAPSDGAPIRDVSPLPPFPNFLPYRVLTLWYSQNREKEKERKHI